MSEQDTEQEQAELRLQLAKLELEHQDYATAIDAMVTAGKDALCIQRFKKKKLALKDEIAKLHAQIIPDIIA